MISIMSINALSPRFVVVSGASTVAAIGEAGYEAQAADLRLALSEVPTHSTTRIFLYLLLDLPTSRFLNLTNLRLALSEVGMTEFRI